MNKFLQGMLVVAGMLLTMGAASAQNAVYDLIASPVSAGAQGGWNVVVTEVNYDFTITSITAEGSPNVPNSGATEVTLDFFSDTSGTINSPDPIATTGDAGTQTPGVADANWGAGAPNGFGGVSWNSPAGMPAYNLTVTNPFGSAVGTVVTGVTTAQSFQVLIQDGHQWNTAVTLISPEASSMLLLLAALAPLGLLAWRRRTTNTG